MNDDLINKLKYISNNPLINGEYDEENYLFDDEAKILLDYITNLQKENEKLKQKLNCKEYFSSTMPENTEFVILTKENYDRQQKDIELELIDYKSRNEKAIEWVKKNMYYFPRPDDLLNILNGGDDNE